MISLIGKILRKIRSRRPLLFWLSSPGSSTFRPLLWEYPKYITLGKRVTIRENSWISAIPKYAGQEFLPKIIIEDEVYIGRYACITCVDEVRIGAGSVLSEHVYIADSGHGINPDGPPIMQQRLESKGPVVLGTRCFVGYGARILPGVTLGNNCVVGANSVVTRSFPEGSMVAGIPAALIKTFVPTSGKWEAVPR